jgi:predicted permease
MDRVDLLRDLRHAWRSLARSPGVTAVAVVALALGIGANTAVFSVVNSILLKPVPFAEPDRLVMLMLTANGNPFFPGSSPAQFAHFETTAHTLEDLAAFTATSVNYTGPDASVRVAAAEVSEAYFRTFRTTFVRGRGFTRDEAAPGGGRVAVVSHAFWTRYLEADPLIVGRAISLNGDTYTVIGIVGPELDLRELGAPEVWTPLAVDPGTTTQAYLYRVAARLKPGVTLEQAQAELAASTAAFRERFPDVLGPRAGFGALGLKDAFVRPDTRTTLLVLAGAVCFVLLLACANVAYLLLVRATRRLGEIGVRRALGASSLRIVQALLMEGLLLCIAGCALGLLVGFLGMRALLSIDTAGLPRLGDAGALLGLDWRVVTFTVAVSFVTGIVSSLAPAVLATRSNLAGAINDAGTRTGGGRQNLAHSTLVVVEVAVAVILMVGAALLVRTSIALSRVDVGFDPDGLVTMQTVPDRRTLCDYRERHGNPAARTRAASFPAGRRRRRCDVLHPRGARDRLAVQHRGARRSGAVHGQQCGRIHVARLLRSARYSAAPRPGLWRRRHRRRSARRRRQRGARSSVLDRRCRSAARSHADRRRRRQSRGARRRAGAPDRWHRRQRARRGARERPRPDHVCAPGANAGRAHTASGVPDTDDLGRTQAKRWCGAGATD